MPDGTYEVSGGKIPYGSYIEIPATHQGKPVTRIADYAFSDMSSLFGITIPNSVKTIGDGAFIYCRDLREVSIPQSVTSIGTAAFTSALSLTSMTVDPNNEYYRFDSNGNYLLEIQTKTLKVGFADTVIPSDGTVTIHYHYTPSDT